MHDRIAPVAPADAVTIACPECGRACQVWWRDGLRGQCNACWPWEPESEAVIIERGLARQQAA